ncbi:MAG: imidazoleglycerol-phosphate dehydratase HisB [Methanoregulaceae archaeon]|nr:imidazoleglycerol-phosphate dehydratase HisB [Methanoregulaceae archaeon]
MRESKVSRETKETNIHIDLKLDGKGTSQVATGIPFFDHMLQAMTRHGRFDLEVRATGDLEVDTHHTVEDVGIVLGTAVRQAVGEGVGIRRFGHAIVPMDEALATVALDLGGRGYLVFAGTFHGRRLGNMDVDIFEHFFHSLTARAGITAHISFSGRNDHHQCEAVFKAFGIALGDAAAASGNTGVPSTKGTF